MTSRPDRPAKKMLAAAILALAIVAAACGEDELARTGCTSDEDCKSGRVCSEGRCVDPAESSAAQGEGADASIAGIAGAAGATGGVAGGAGTEPGIAGTSSMTPGVGGASGAAGMPASASCVANVDGSMIDTDPAARFLGAWTEATTMTVSCPGDLLPTSASTSGRAMVARGTSSDLVRTGSSGTVICPILLDISADGARAELARAEPCDLGDVVITFQTWVMTANADGRTATVTGAGTGTISGMTCTTRLSGTATRAEANCTAEIDAAFCARSERCGCVTGSDNCGKQRAVRCGSPGDVRCNAAQPETCDGSTWQDSGPACANACTIRGDGFACTCPAGFTGDGVGASGCSDVDECAQGSDQCDRDPAAVCTNMMGSYGCMCPAGTVGDGVGENGCDVDECSQGTHDCDSSPAATCINTTGGYDCACGFGYTGSGHGGSGCTDLDECAAASHNCDTGPDACVNTEGRFLCRCPATHRGEGIGDDGCAWKVRAISSSGMHTCAVLEDESLRCWGVNSDGELGLGDATHRGDQVSELADNLPRVDLGTNRLVRAVSAGDSHTCALLDDGAVKCWGDNALGQLGLGDSVARGSMPGQVGDALPAVNLGAGAVVRAIAAGGSHTCALLDDGRIKCWGANVSGQLGLGDLSNRGDAAGEMGDALARVELGTGRTAIAIAAGGAHSCALLDDGSVKCWGSGIYGRLGTGNATSRGGMTSDMGDALPKVELGTGRTARAISAGGAHSCALLDDGSIKCWGNNGSGVLGLGDTVARGLQASELGDGLPRVELGTGRTATAIAAGPQHTCALLDDGTLKCWGRNNVGLLGLGDTQSRGDEPGEMGDSLPIVNMGVDRTVRAVAAGSLHTCALLDDGAVKCWGDSAYGMLGLGDAIDRGDQIGEMGDSLPAVNVGGL